MAKNYAASFDNPDLHQERKIRPPFLLYTIILLYTLTIFNGIFRGEYSILDYFALKEGQNILYKRVLSLDKETKALAEEISNIKESKEYAQKILKDKYHITEENEHIVFFTD